MMRPSYLPRLWSIYGVQRFRYLERGDRLFLVRQIGVTSASISRAKEEVRILGFFPDLEKSKAQFLLRLKINRELICFSQKYNIYHANARELYELVKGWRKEIEENLKILLTDAQHDLIIGSTLGGASIKQRNKNCQFRISHVVKQKKYVGWKFKILEGFKSSGNTHYVFNFYRRIFYGSSGVKKIKRESLILLNPQSFAVWLCDDGCYSKKQGCFILCTNSYSFEEDKLMKVFFEEKFSVRLTIGFRDKKYYHLRFLKRDTEKIIKIVKPFIPLGMKYKIGEEDE